MAASNISVVSTGVAIHDEVVPDQPISLSLEAVRCCICDRDDAEPLAVGEDFEYATSRDSFLAMRCRGCGLVYLNPRPSLDELSRIYPSNYHAFDFSEENFGFVYKVRRRLEARRALSWCKHLGDDARIIDIGCGDGFHLGLLREFGKPAWKLEGVDNDQRAAESADRSGLKVHTGNVESLDLPHASYDIAFLIQTIEHVYDPPRVLRAVHHLLKPGGRVVIMTDNTASLDFKLFKGRHWGGYHFPRHWNLFNSSNLGLLARKVGFEVEALTTAVSPVNWVYSIRNTLVDLQAPRWLSNRFSLESTASLSVFTIFDTLNQLLGKGALLHATLRKPV
ncbi:MAG TPA: class I SAM-dependent methyltransferase [Pyrinomonadaceae bacterium]|jgi:2-polyprenyl-3-methyl-5-hydroxy-6-metoxy-1,4-benzoquinol methylase